MIARIRRWLGREPKPEVAEFIATMRDARREALIQTKASRHAQRELRQRQQNPFEGELLQRETRKGRGNA